MTDTNSKVDHTTEELNVIWNKTETKTDTLNRQLLGMVPFIINKEKVYQFIICQTGKKIHEALFATDSKNWSQKKIDKIKITPIQFDLYASIVGIIFLRGYRQ